MTTVKTYLGVKIVADLHAKKSPALGEASFNV